VKIAAPQSLFAILAVDAATGTALGVVWYLGFDVLMGWGQSPQIHPGEYGRAWLLSFIDRATGVYPMGR